MVGTGKSASQSFYMINVEYSCWNGGRVGENPKTLCYLLIQKGMLLTKVQEERGKILSEETERTSGAISPEGGRGQCYNESTWTHLEPQKQPVCWLQNTACQMLTILEQ